MLGFRNVVHTVDDVAIPGGGAIFHLAQGVVRPPRYGVVEHPLPIAVRRSHAGDES